MEPKLIKTTLASYIPASWDGENRSGATPIGDRVLIKPDKAAEVIGGVHIPVDVAFRMTMAAEAGVVVALGEGAFAWNPDKVTSFSGIKPKVGDRVCIEKYSGQLLRGDDGEEYRLMDASCIAAILVEKKESK